MAAIVWSDVVAVAKEMVDPKVSATAQEMILSWANTGLKVSVWGGEASLTLKLGRCLRAAHLGTLCSTGGVTVAGPVVSESEGGLSRSYALLSSITSGNTDPNYSSTTYGNAYMTIISGLAGARLPFVPGQGSSIP